MLMHRGMIWNIDNGGTLDLLTPNIGNISNVVNTIHEVNPDFAVLPEYMIRYSNNLITNGLRQIGFDHFCVNKNNQDKDLRKRVLIASKYEITDISDEGNINSYDLRNWREVQINDLNIHLLAVDVPLAETKDLQGNKKNNRHNKKIFLDAMLLKAQENKYKEISFAMLGDFNLHPDAVFPEYLEKFNNELQEITDGNATWNDKKLDYIFVNDCFIKKITTVSSPKSTAYSDHCYIYFDFED